MSMIVGYAFRGVPRQIYPSPQKLVDIGDKQRVLEFLMDQYYEIQDFQIHDAPALVGYLMGDDAVRPDRIRDAFRNAAAQRGIENLWNAIHTEVVFEADIAKYQERYDRISGDADRTAEAYVKCVAEWRAPSPVGVCTPKPGCPLPKAAPTPAASAVKVEVGQRWRRVRDHLGKNIEPPPPPLQVSSIQRRSCASAHDYATFLLETNHTMWLDDHGRPFHPEEWKLVSGPEVRVGHTWRRRRTGDLIKIAVIVKADDGEVKARAHGDPNTPHGFHVSIDENGFCLHPELWELVSGPGGPEVDALDRWRRTVDSLTRCFPPANRSTSSACASTKTSAAADPEEWQRQSQLGKVMPKVALGQLWVHKPHSGGKYPYTVRSVQPGMAKLEGKEVIEKMVMFLDDDGYPQFPEHWDPPPSRSLVVKPDQVWYQKLGDGGRSGRVTEIQTHPMFGRVAHLMGNVETFETFVMDLDELGRPFDTDNWSLTKG